MRAFTRFCLPICVVFFFLLVGCGDDVVEGVNQGTCLEGEDRNPITGQCVPRGSGGENWGDSDGNSGGGSGDGTGGTGDGNGGGTGDVGGGTGDGTGGTGDGTGGTGDGTGNGSGDPQECGNGAITGQACTPDQQTLPGANIKVSGVDCDGNPFEITTQAGMDGTFTLENVPAGNQELTVSLGSFSGVQIVRIFPDDVTDMTADGKKACLDGSGVPIAIVNGQYDNVGQLLNSLEIEYDTIGSSVLSSGAAGAFLQDYDQMLQYQILFIECGGLWGSLSSSLGGFFGGTSVNMNTVRTNLRNFVESGRSLYVSDQAYQFVREIFPEAANFRSNATVGIGNQTVTANVISNDMLTLLGSNTAQVHFNLNEWAVMESAPPGVVVHFEGDAQISAGGSTTTLTGIPFLVSYTHPANQGTVIYTSFHNSEQGSMGGDMEEVLRFLIFQL